MERKKLARRFRGTKLSPEEAARDADVRSKVMEEFPPAEPALAENGALSENLKAAIRGSSKSVYQICKEADISPIAVSRFLSGERDIRLATADRLAKVLGLTVASH